MASEDNSFVLLDPAHVDKGVQTNFSADDLPTNVAEEPQVHPSRRDEAIQVEEEAMEHSGGGDDQIGGIKNPRVSDELVTIPLSQKPKLKDRVKTVLLGPSTQPAKPQQHNSGGSPRTNRPTLQSHASHPPNNYPPVSNPPSEASLPGTIHPSNHPSGYTPEHSAPVQLTTSAARHTKGQPPTKKTLILLGKTGAGKATIGQHVFNLKGNTLGSINSATRTPTAYRFKSRLAEDLPLINIQVIDTNGMYNASHRGDPPRIQRSDSQQRYSEQQEVKTYPVNGIFFVMHTGRVTKEDCNPFYEIIKVIGSIPNIRNICYLIITGCEGLDQAGIESLRTMYKKDGMTGHICRFVKDILFVGFPDLDAMMPELQEYYQKGIDAHKVQLQKVAKELCSAEVPCWVPDLIPVPPDPANQSDDQDSPCAIM